MMGATRSAWLTLLLGLSSTLACSLPDVSVERPQQLQQALGTTRSWFVTPLVPIGGMPDQFGSDVAISGKTAVIAASGAAYVFVLSEDGWHQQATLEPPLDFAGTGFASSVAISGDTVIVGAPSMDSSPLPGTAYVYERSGDLWSAPVKLAADDGIARDIFGFSVAISGDIAAVGALYASIGDSESGGGSEGAAYVFTRSDAGWTQTKKLSASDGAPGDQFGCSLAISGTNVLVGASLWPQDYSGAAYLYSTTDWQERKLRPPDTFTGDEFGHSVALRDGVAVVGARAHRGRLAPKGYRQGAAFLYNLAESDAPSGQILLADDGKDLDWFGTAVGVSGSTVMVGAPQADDVYIFDTAAPGAGPLHMSERGERPFLGGALELDGDIAAIGAEYSSDGAYVAELLSADGSSCQSNEECRGRHCVDGICCNTACSGACESCETGTCTATPESPGTPSCSPYWCSEAGGACPTQCVAHSSCVETHYCSDHRCMPRVPNGGQCDEARACVSGRCIDGQCAGSSALSERCQSASDCESGFCVDGYCCDQRCLGQCEACDVRAQRGTCTTISGVPHGQRDSCAGAGTVCGGSCDGEHSAACSYPTSSTSCGSSCREGMQTDSACDGQGDCQAREPQSCGNFVCADELTCKTSCQEIGDCLSGFTCQNGHCESGATCLDEQRAQGADGVVEDCAPYLCDSGSCKSECEVSDRDCTLDSVCNSKHHCVPRPPPSRASSSDSGCSVAPTHSPETRGTLLSSAALLALLAVVRRRRNVRAQKF